MTKLDNAIQYAVGAHSGQVRKLSGAPYILHPLEAATIVGSITSDEDIIIAALLHDVVEDAGKTNEEIKTLFGARVAALVASETENKREHISPDKTWKIRKQETLSALSETGDVAVKILWLGDKLSNVRSLYRAYLEEGDEMWNHFNQKDKSEQKWYYSTIAKLLGQDLSHCAAWREYDFLVKEIFG